MKEGWGWKDEFSSGHTEVEITVLFSSGDVLYALGCMPLGFCRERDLRVVDTEKVVGTGEQGGHLKWEKPWAEEGSKMLGSRSG